MTHWHTITPEQKAAADAVMEALIDREVEDAINALAAVLVSTIIAHAPSPAEGIDTARSVARIIRQTVRRRINDDPADTDGMMVQ